MEEKNLSIKNKIVFIIPYFGTFHNYFPLFLKSCEKNKKYCDWLIFTDDETHYQFPDNVTMKHLCWEEMKQYIQNKFYFQISLEKPYKLCDFKTAYGYLFEEFIVDYEYWGCCDIDLIWGNFESFWQENLFSNYKKIFNLGHCTIYKNEFENNRVFFKTINGRKRCQEVFTCRRNCSFDEEYKDSINNIYQFYHIPIYEDSFAANLYTKTSNFRLVHMNSTHDRYFVEARKKNFFVWNDGILKRYVWDKNTFKQEEYLYIHFQSRKMKVHLKDMNCQVFKIIPNAFDDLEIDDNEINFQNVRKVKWKYFNMHYFTLRTSNLIQKIKKRLSKK